MIGGFFANIDFNFLRFPRKLKGLCSCFTVLTIDVDWAVPGPAYAGVSGVKLVVSFNHRV